MALVIKSDLHIRHVQNLGWLRAHWQEVKSFAVRSTDDSKYTDAYMAAYLTDGTVYMCSWASDTVMRQWLHRPIFRGLMLDWYGQITVC